MNTEMIETIRQAEGRYLTDSEIDVLRSYAVDFTQRLAAARGVEARERKIVDDAVERYLARRPEAAGQRAAVEEELRTTLRYATQAFVKKDMAAFEKDFVPWFAELVLALAPREEVVQRHAFLKAALEEHLDPIDARKIAAYLETWIAELAR